MPARTRRALPGSRCARRRRRSGRRGAASRPRRAGRDPLADPARSGRGRCRPRTCAALTVQAASASAGLSPSCVQASVQTTGRLSQYALPGLKSVASATAAPASTSARAGGIGRPRKSAATGSSTPTTSLAARAATPCRARRLEVVDRAGAELDREWHGAELGELIAVQSQRQPGGATGLQVAPRLVDVERAALDEDVRGRGDARRVRGAPRGSPSRRRRRRPAARAGLRARRARSGTPPAAAIAAS